MAKCPKCGAPAPNFAPGSSVRCTGVKNGINCDEIYTIGSQQENQRPESTPVRPGRGGNIPIR